MAHPNDPPRSQPEYDEGLEEGEVDDDEGNDGEITPGYEAATPSTSAYSSFESNKLEESITEDNEEIEVEKEMAEAAAEQNRKAKRYPYDGHSYFPGVKLK